MVNTNKLPYSNEVFSTETTVSATKKPSKLRVLKPTRGFIAGVFVTSLVLTTLNLNTDPVVEKQLATPKQTSGASQDAKTTYKDDIPNNPDYDLLKDPPAVYPTHRPEPMPTAIPARIVTPGPTGNLGQLSQQIITAQQQRTAFAQACIANANRMAAGVAAIKNQSNALDQQIKQVSYDMSNYRSTGADQARYQALKNRRDQLYDQRSRLRQTTYDRQRDFSKYKSSCKTQMYSYERVKSSAETQYVRTFNNSLNIYVR